MPPSSSPPRDRPEATRFPPCPELAQNLRGALLLPGSSRPARSLSGSRVKGAFSKVKARLAGTWGFSPAEHELCNRIVKDHGSGRKSERPHRSANRGFILQRRTHSDRPGISGPWNVAKTKPCPPPKHTTTSCLRGVGSSGPLSLRLKRSARFCQVWGGLSLYRRKKKKRFKSTSLLWFLYQRPSTCYRLRQLWEAGRGE